MGRPQKTRRICKEPKYCNFVLSDVESEQTITLFVDEFETIRLVDYNKCTHEECAKLMDISRTTVTDIYENARYKIADAIINGKNLNISGGRYRLCDGTSVTCKCVNCKKKHKKLLHDM